MDKQKHFEIKAADLKLKTFSEVLASMPENPSEKQMGEEHTEKEFYTKSEVNEILSNIYSNLLDSMNYVYSSLSTREDKIINALNQWIKDHSEGHLPKMHSGQIKSILSSAGILGDFEDQKPPLKDDVKMVYANIKKLDFKVK